jgi:hypothetical protein
MRCSTAIGTLCFLSAACGGGAPAAPPPAAPHVTGEIRPVTQAQANLAHYKTTDGVYGLVLDRTGPTPKAQVDGQKDIVELTMREDRVTRSGMGPAGSLLGYVFLTPDGTRLLYVGVDGDVHYFHGNDDLMLTSDRGADPLPAATVTGTAPEPVAKKSATEQLEDSLAAIAVRTKMTQYSSDDAADLGKVAAAIGALDAAGFVHFVASGHTGKFAPIPKNWQDAYMGDAPKAKTGIGKYHASLFPILELNDDLTKLKSWGLQLSRPPEAPADNTPGILWEIADHDAAFVTLDGGRYLLSISGTDGAPVIAGVGKIAMWPAPLQHSALGPAAIRSLADLGVVPPKTADDAKAAQEEWRQCAEGTVAALKPQLDAIDQANLNPSTKAARRKATVERWQASTTAKCAPKGGKLESLVVGVTEARNKDRLALLEKAKARVAALNPAQ